MPEQNSINSFKKSVASKESEYDDDPPLVDEELQSEPEDEGQVLDSQEDLPQLPADYEDQDSASQNARLNGLKALFEQSSMLLSKLDEKKSDSIGEAEQDYNALGEKMELRMITEEVEEKTNRTMKSVLTEEEVVMLIEEKHITI